MIKDDKAYNALRFWKMVVSSFRSYPTILYEIFNEPHTISPHTWWYGDEYYFGYKEIVLAIREISNQIIILNGLDYAYQLNFLQYELDILLEIKSFSNIMFGSHPYAYKGFPSDDHLNTISFSVNYHNHTSCVIGYTTPKFENYTKGWIDSFAYLHLSHQFPVILTEIGLDQYETSLQGGWYIDQLLRFIEKHHLHFVAWAWVADRLDYPSLINEHLQPIGIASIGHSYPACAVRENHYYPGPGKIVYQHIQHVPFFDNNDNDNDSSSYNSNLRGTGRHSFPGSAYPYLTLGFLSSIGVCCTFYILYKTVRGLFGCPCTPRTSSSIE